MKKRKLKLKILAWFTIVIAGIIYFYCTCVLPVILTECRTKAQNLVRQHVNACSLELLSEEKAADNFVCTTQNGSVPILSVNSKEINKLALAICNNSQNALISTNNSSISIKLGTMSGIVLLSNIGPDVNINIVPVNTVCYNYDVKTENVGINQVHYRIILKIVSSVSLLIPGKPETAEIVTEVLISDCILTGCVPDVIFGVKTYDLVP